MIAYITYNFEPMKTSMRLIKLYRKLFEFRKEYLKKLRELNHLWVYKYSDYDGVLVRQIFEIEKTLN